MSTPSHDGKQRGDTKRPAPPGRTNAILGEAAAGASRTAGAAGAAVALQRTVGNQAVSALLGGAGVSGSGRTPWPALRQDMGQSFGADPHAARGTVGGATAPGIARAPEDDPARLVSGGVSRLQAPGDDAASGGLKQEDSARILQAGPEYWIDHAPNAAGMPAVRLRDEANQIDEWLRRQTATTPELARLKAVRDRLRGEISARDRRIEQPRQPAGKPAHKATQTPARTGGNNAPAAADKPAPVPRFLREHTSIATSEPAVLEREYDEISAYLQNQNVPKGDRKLLLTELANLKPELSRQLQHRSNTRHAQAVGKALAPAMPSGDVNLQMLDAVRHVDSIRPISGKPGYNYLVRGHEMIVMSDAEVDTVRASTLQALDRMAADVPGGNDSVLADYNEFVDRTYEKHPIVGAISMLRSGENPLDWDERLMPLVQNSNIAYGQYTALRKAARDPWGDPRAALSPIAEQVARGVRFNDEARGYLDYKTGQVLEGTAGAVDYLNHLKTAGQIAAGFAFSLGAAAFYNALESTLVQSEEISYGQREGYDVAGIAVDAGSAYFGAKLGGAASSFAGEASPVWVRGLSYVVGGRTGAAATTALHMSADRALGRNTASAGDILSASAGELTDIQGGLDDIAYGAVGHYIHHGAGTTGHKDAVAPAEFGEPHAAAETTRPADIASHPELALDRAAPNETGVPDQAPRATPEPTNPPPARAEPDDIASHPEPATDLAASTETDVPDPARSPTPEPANPPAAPAEPAARPAASTKPAAIASNPEPAAELVAPAEPGALDQAPHATPEPAHPPEAPTKPADIAPHPEPPAELAAPAEPGALDKAPHSTPEPAHPPEAPTKPADIAPHPEPAAELAAPAEPGALDKAPHATSEPAHPPEASTKPADITPHPEPAAELAAPAEPGALDQARHATPEPAHSPEVPTKPVDQARASPGKPAELPPPDQPPPTPAEARRAARKEKGEVVWAATEQLGEKFAMGFGLSPGDRIRLEGRAKTQTEKYRKSMEAAGYKWVETTTPEAGRAGRWVEAAPGPADPKKAATAQRRRDRMAATAKRNLDKAITEIHEERTQLAEKAQRDFYAKESGPTTLDLEHLDFGPGTNEPGERVTGRFRPDVHLPLSEPKRVQSAGEGTSEAGLMGRHGHQPPRGSDLISEHVQPGAQFEHVTGTPSGPIYDANQYGYDITIQVPKDVADIKTHKGPFSDNKRTEALKQKTARGEPIDVVQDIYLPSLRQTFHAIDTARQQRGGVPGGGGSAPPHEPGGSGSVPPHEPGGGGSVPPDEPGAPRPRVEQAPGNTSRDPSGNPSAAAQSRRSGREAASEDRFGGANPARETGNPARLELPFDTREDSGEPPSPPRHEAPTPHETAQDRTPSEPAEKRPGEGGGTPHTATQAANEAPAPIPFGGTFDAERERSGADKTALLAGENHPEDANTAAGTPANDRAGRNDGQVPVEAAQSTAGETAASFLVPGKGPDQAIPAGAAKVSAAQTSPAAPESSAVAAPPTAANPAANASRRSTRVAADETSFGDAEFDTIARDARNSRFGQNLEASKRQTPAPLPEDTTRTRAQVDQLAHSRARNNAPAGRVPGAEIQHQTKTLDVTRNLPAGMNPLDANTINENILWLQSRRNLPSTALHVDPRGGGTRIYIDDVPRGRIGDAGMRGEQLDLFNPSAGSREPDYNTEHKFMDNYLIPETAAQIEQSRRDAGLQPLDPRMLAIAAGEQSRWVLTGESGSSRSGRVLDIASQATARPAAPAQPAPAEPPSAQLELLFGAPPASSTPAAPAAPAAAPAPGTATTAGEPAGTSGPIRAPRSPDIPPESSGTGGPAPAPHSPETPPTPAGTGSPAPGPGRTAEPTPAPRNPATPPAPEGSSGGPAAPAPEKPSGAPVPPKPTGTGGTAPAPHSPGTSSGPAGTAGPTPGSSGIGGTAPAPRTPSTTNAPERGGHPATPAPEKPSGAPVPPVPDPHPPASGPVPEEKSSSRAQNEPSRADSALHGTTAALNEGAAAVRTADAYKDARKRGDSVPGAALEAGKTYLENTNVVAGALANYEAKKKDGQDPIEAALSAGGETLGGLIVPGKGWDQAINAVDNLAGAVDDRQKRGDPNASANADKANYRTATDLAAGLTPSRMFSGLMGAGLRSYWDIGKAAGGDTSGVDKFADDAVRGKAAMIIQPWAMATDFLGNLGSGEGAEKALDKTLAKTKGSTLEKAGSASGDALYELGQSDAAKSGKYGGGVQVFSMLLSATSDHIAGKSWEQAFKQAAEPGKDSLLVKAGTAGVDAARGAREKITEVVDKDIPAMKAAVQEKLHEANATVSEFKAEAKESVRELKAAASDKWQSLKQGAASYLPSW